MRAFEALKTKRPYKFYELAISSRNDLSGIFPMFVMISVAPLVIYLRAYEIFPMLPIKFLRYEAIKHDLVIKRRKKTHGRKSSVNHVHTYV